MSIVRKSIIAATIAWQPLVAEANEASFNPRGIDEARTICATLDAPVEGRAYVRACMRVYLDFMQRAPAEWKAPFHEDLNHLARAQMMYERGMKGFNEYFAVVRDRTCRIAEEFRARPLIDWAMGEIVVGVAEMVQERAAGNTDARIPMEAGEIFKGCKPPSLTS